MPSPELNRGDKGSAVKHLQSLLNRIGSMLNPDGDFGAGTERAVRYAQSQADLTPTGTADQPLWDWLGAQPEPFPQLATDGVSLIAREETGGLAYYQAVTRWPHFPGEQSGLTIGMGYDLRFNDEAQFAEDWGGQLPASMARELQKDIGKRGSKKRALELKNAGYEVPFSAAWEVFVAKTLPRYYGLTESIYPSLGHLPAMCRSVLVSIVFNRGSSLKGPSRSEMRAIRDILAEADDLNLNKPRRKSILESVEDEIVSMKRLWGVNSGLVRRRQAEANVWRDGLQNW